MTEFTDAEIEERQAAIEELSQYHSQQEIADQLGISRKVVRQYQQKLQITPAGRNGHEQQREKDTPFVVVNERGRTVCKAASSRFTDGVSEINGICRGIRDLDFGMVVAVMTEEEIKVWIRKTKEISMALNGFHKRLKEVVENGSS